MYDNREMHIIDKVLKPPTIRINHIAGDLEKSVCRWLLGGI
jgi:hypothetical protein